MPEDIGYTVPPGACDCHMHVFGTPEQFPPAPVRAYNPTEATLPQYRAVWQPLGLQRIVLVQPSAYGTDNGCMQAALLELPALTRGIAVIDAATSDVELDALDAAGVRGIRLNLVSNGQPDPVAATAQLRAAADRVGPRGWHVQIFALPDLIAALAPAIRTLPVPVVIDHMGAVNASLGPTPPGLDTLLRLLEAGHCWVKVSGINRISRQPRGFRDGLPIMRALISANPDRVVWGSDWPHIGPHDVGAPKTVVYMPHDNADLLRILGEATRSTDDIRRVLVENPARLYGFI